MPTPAADGRQWREIEWLLCEANDRGTTDAPARSPRLGSSELGGGLPACRPGRRGRHGGPVQGGVADLPHARAVPSPGCTIVTALKQTLPDGKERKSRAISRRTIVDMMQ